MDAAKISDEELVVALRNPKGAEDNIALIKEGIARILSKMAENEWGPNEIGGP